MHSVIYVTLKHGKFGNIHLVSCFQEKGNTKVFILLTFLSVVKDEFNVENVIVKNRKYFADIFSI